MCTICIWFGRQFILYLLTGFGVTCLKHYSFVVFFFFSISITSEKIRESVTLLLPGH